MVKLMLLVLPLLFTGCFTDSQDAPTVELQGDLFIHKTLGFTLELPAGWSHTLSEKYQGTPLDVVSRHVPQNGFMANIIAVNGPHSGSAEMTLVLPAYEAALQSQIPSVVILEDTVTVIQGIPVASLTYTAEIMGNTQTTRELLFVKNNRDVQIIFSDLASTFGSRSEFTATEASLTFQ